MIRFLGEAYPDNTACVVCRHLLEGAPVCLAERDVDGDLQFLCGAAGHTDEDGRIIALEEVDLSLYGLDRLPARPGAVLAERLPGGDWLLTDLDE